jgi:hypothetical protein
MEKMLKSIIIRQLPFLIGGTIAGIIITYYFGFFFSIIVNSAIWYVISVVAYKLVWKSNGMRDQKYLFNYFMKEIRSRHGKKTAD